MEIKINAKEIFERADIKHVREFILGKDIIAKNYYGTGTYQERLDRDSEDIIYAIQRLSKESAEENQSDKAMQDLEIALLAYRDVFTEIGMKIGARFLFQLLYQEEY